MKSLSSFATCLALLLAVVSSCSEKADDKAPVEPLAYDQITVAGELSFRLFQNLDRLSGDKYLPDRVFLSEEQSGGWPGDTEGRTILGLVCDARASHKDAGTLKEIISLVPEHLNSLGYMGPEYGDRLNEQQLSGNGWMLRGLCAYYDWTSDAQVLDWIRSIANNLFVKGKGMYAKYPIDPSLRVTGEGKESGNITDTEGGWMLSTDTGCVFIGMDGLIDAYRLVGTPEMKEVIEEMLARFLEMDLVAVQAQTHASLTACRALVRYAELTGEEKWIQEAADRWEIYKQYGMTETFGNYNWFRRYDTWSEPCAIVDSYILAQKLWQHTRDSRYLTDAQLIYYNALCHSQRANGGFGCDSCPGEASGPELTVKTDEAHWCCTMRGAEGLATAAAYTIMREGNVFYVNNLRPCKVGVEGLSFDVETEYPWEGMAVITVTKNSLGDDAKVKIFIPYWMFPRVLEVNGKQSQPKVGEDGFLTVGKLSPGTKIIIEYSYSPRKEETLNKENTRPGQSRYFSGPFMLNEEGNPIYHLMDPAVTRESGYHHQVIL